MIWIKEMGFILLESINKDIFVEVADKRFRIKIWNIFWFRVKRFMGKCTNYFSILQLCNEKYILYIIYFLMEINVFHFWKIIKLKALTKIKTHFFKCIFQMAQ